MKIRIWIHQQDNGDGSSSACFYKTEAEANAAAEQEMEDFGQALNDNVYYEDIVVEDYEVIE